MTAAQPHVFIDTDYVEEPPRPGCEGLWGQIFENGKAPRRPAFGPACRQGQALCFLFMGAGDEKPCAFRESAGVKGGKKPCYLENM